MGFEKGKITVRQAMFLVITVIFSPLVRIAPNFAAFHARQAAWVVPIASSVLFLIAIYILYGFAKEYDDKDFTQIMEQIFGKVVSRAISFMYLLWLVFLAALALRYYAERLLSTILPNVNIVVVLVPMYAVGWAVARKSTVTLARMNEVIIFIIAGTLALCALFAIPNINPDNLLPVSYLDIKPILSASLGIMGVWSYLPIIFLFLPIIKNKTDVKSSGVKAVCYLGLFSLISVGMAVGMLGNLILTLTPAPFFVAIKQVSVLGYIERLEALIISLWIVSDFVLLALLITLMGNITKRIFNLQEERPLASAYVFILFSLSLLMCRNVFEMQEFSRKIAVYIHFVLGVVVPFVVFVIGKIKNKAQSKMPKKSTAL
ncbi:MAG: GerAB/ArcD/ProY family transporter [Eubacteriales bacterium]|nr:GerAB/ArcD/ProY family transporter [Eubacteriales bacterium]